MKKMKKTILLVTILFISIFSYGQFSLKINDVVVVDGYSFNYYTTGSEADITFVLTNEADTDINVVCTVESITNNVAGDNLQFCWGLCYTTIAEGNQYPSAPEVLAPGASTAPAGNHFENSDLGDDPDSPVVYVFKFHEVDTEGELTGDPITITYTYDISLSVEDESIISYKLFPTTTDENFTLVVEESVTGTIVNTNGQVVKTFVAETGSNTINVAELANQMYYVVLTNTNGKKSLTKIIIN
jgi:hypothetical protein